VTDIFLTTRHAREMKFCFRGIRKWMLKHDLSWAEFVKNGIPAEKLEATGDAMAIKAVRMARGTDDRV
jgi:hypothetical protein